MEGVDEPPPARRLGRNDMFVLVDWLVALLRACLNLVQLQLLGETRLGRRRLQVIRSVDKVGIASASRDQETVVFVDGAVLASGSCGIGVYYSFGHPRNAHGGFVCPEGVQADSNLSELAAIYWVLVRHPCELPLSIYSDSAHALRCVEAIADEEATQGLSSRARRRQASAATTVSDERWSSLVWLIHALLRLRRAPTRFCKVKGHAGSRKNETADALAQRGAESGPLLPVPIRASRLDSCRLLLGYLLCQKPPERATKPCLRRWQQTSTKHANGGREWLGVGTMDILISLRNNLSHSHNKLPRWLGSSSFHA